MAFQVCVGTAILPLSMVSWLAGMTGPVTM